MRRCGWWGAGRFEHWRKFASAGKARPQAGNPNVRVHLQVVVNNVGDGLGVGSGAGARIMSNVIGRRVRETYRQHQMVSWTCVSLSVTRFAM